MNLLPIEDCLLLVIAARKGDIIMQLWCSGRHVIKHVLIPAAAVDHKRKEPQQAPSLP